MTATPTVVTQLSAAHRRELETDSGIDRAVIEERGYRTLQRGDSAALDEEGIGVRADLAFPGLFIPMFRATGERISAQFKPAKPVMLKGRKKPVKYLSPRARPSVLDVHPRNRERIRDVSVPLWITEGVKKGDSLTSRGCCVVTLSGVFNWRDRLGTLGDWEDVPLKKRTVIVCFDADAAVNSNVARAMRRLGEWLKSKGASAVSYVVVPGECGDRKVKGVDDYFTAGGTLESLRAVASTTPPDPDSHDDSFSEARLAETVVEEALADAFLWCGGLGWMEYDGKRWKPVSDERTTDIVREYALRQHADAVRQGKHSEAHGWHSVLSAARLRAILTLARGIVEESVDAFDADPDLLNTPGGVVDLRTGTVAPHCPDLLLTKIARGSYRAGFTHPDWDSARRALPEDADEWMQRRVGQAITGEATADGVVLLGQGTGENGKTCLFESLIHALGDYAAPASMKLLAGSNEHPTERADLRGLRLIIAEELMEGRALNVTAIKQITDVSVIKARLIRKDNVAFKASHTLIVTSNYLPHVEETDHGTWRRLVRVPFPFIFRKPGVTCVTEADRVGDPHLKRRLRDGKDAQHDGVVSWAVEGAVLYYRHHFLPLPASVERATREWRREADPILRFWDERLVADRTAKVLAIEMFDAFADWASASGCRALPKETFHPKFKKHGETLAQRVVEQRTVRLEGLRRRPGAFDAMPKQPVVYLGVRFRTDDDRRPDHPEPDRADVADAGEDDRHDRRSGDIGGGYEPSATCCNGGELQLRCKLCKASPIYWERQESARS